MTDLRQIARAAYEQALEFAVKAASLRAPSSACPQAPEKIFILRNNDIGDLLIITPLFESLRRKFPHAEIVAGTGDWCREVLLNNPHLSGVLSVNAPWFNRSLHKHSLEPLKYLAASPEIMSIKEKKFGVGIDVLGSSFGSLLMMKAGIPYRLGVKGYAGGHTGVQDYVEYNPLEQVGRAALRFAEKLGVRNLPELKPQLFLTSEERAEGEKIWSEMTGGKNLKRVLIGPGGGLKAKRWPLENYVQLIKLMGANKNLKMAVAGGPQDREAGVILKQAGAEDWTGRLTLRQTFALIAASDYVISNPSMLMHAAAAFSKPVLVLLGPAFESQSRHFAQWGYPGECYHLGMEKGSRDSLYSPAEALDFFERKILGGTEAARRS